ncbi:Interleukin-18 receptor 1, partial [Eschrichtius robustus]|nr:Interleukin-18 receptor 1 [Eschrichtius robustus]
KEVQLNCSALLNEKDVIYWNIWKKNGKDPNVHEEEGTRIRVLQCLPDGGHPPPKRSNFHPPPEQSSRGPQAQELLRSKDPVDIPGHIFTRGMIVAVLISVVIVCLVTVGAIYRVDLVLFYRHFLGRDETLTDGKTYDAFVSYLKECRPENGEEHTFAVEILPRVLEKHFGYKLCIFERDVVPGRGKKGNIR